MVAEVLWVSDWESLLLSGGVGVGGMDGVTDGGTLRVLEALVERLREEVNDCDTLGVRGVLRLSDMETEFGEDLVTLAVSDGDADIVAVYNVARTNIVMPAGTNHRLPSPSDTMPMNLLPAAAGT